jgi:sec-independent protein translocase protein TatC
MPLEDEQPIWDHLDELAKRLRRILASIVIATLAIAMIPANPAELVKLDFSNYKPMISLIIESIQNSLLPEEVSLIAFTWLDTFYVYVIVAVVAGALICLPFIAYEIYQFVKPALFPNERRSVFGFVSVFSILFSVGAVYAYLILLPTTFRILFRFVYQTRIIPLFSVRDFFNIVSLGLLGSGLFYTFPLLLYTLVKFDLMQVQTLRENRKQIFVGLLIFTAILTPDPTPFTMVLMVVPFYLLYELSIQIISRLGIGDEKKDEIDEGVSIAKELLKKTDNIAPLEA